MEADLKLLIQILNQTKYLLQMIQIEQEIKRKREIGQNQVLLRELNHYQEKACKETEKMKALVDKIVEHLATKNQELDENYCAVQLELEQLKEDFVKKELYWKNMLRDSNYRLQNTEKQVQSLMEKNNQLNQVHLENIQLAMELESKRELPSLLPILKALWQITSRQELVQECLSVCDDNLTFFFGELLRLEWNKINKDESIDAILGILVNLAANQSARKSFFIQNEKESICDILIEILVSSFELNESQFQSLVHIFNNLSFDSESAQLLVQKNALPPLCKISIQRKDKQIQGYVLEILKDCLKYLVLDKKENISIKQQRIQQLQKLIVGLEFKNKS